jgi:hypothetical protein
MSDDYDWTDHLRTSADDRNSVVVCPTSKHVFRPDEEDEDAHLQPCPECGYCLMVVTVDETDDGLDNEIRVAWDEGEGAPLFMQDAARAIRLANKFWHDEGEQEERIQDALTEMRKERIVAEDD